MKEDEEVCGNCIFLKGTFCKYFGEYREPQQEHKEHDCFEPHEVGDNCYNIISEGKMAQNKVEYTIQFFDYAYYPDLEKKLNELGKEGWEYIEKLDKHHYLFKRNN